MWNKGGLFQALLIAAPIMAMLALGIWSAMENWAECRKTNSWMYCNTVLGKR